jgi:hypothetical protein
VDALVVATHLAVHLPLDLVQKRRHHDVGRLQQRQFLFEGVGEHFAHLLLQIVDHFEQADDVIGDVNIWENVVFRSRQLKSQSNYFQLRGNTS